MATDYSPHVDADYPKRVYWGDTHLHSSFSSDAGMFGNNLGPEAAYQFARGELVTASNDQKACLVAPLDFLVVSDHAGGS
jgi:hypothetical protein